MAKFIAQIVVLGGQIIGKAFTQALRQEFQSGNAAKRAAGSAQQGSKQAAKDNLMGMTVDEAKEILNIKEVDPKLIEKSYDYLFGINDKKKGGSFYLQSKVFRAKERLDKELEVENKTNNEAGKNNDRINEDSK